MARMDVDWILNKVSQIRIDLKQMALPEFFKGEYLLSLNKNFVATVKDTGKPSPQLIKKWYENVAMTVFILTSELTQQRNDFHNLL